MPSLALVYGGFRPLKAIHSSTLIRTFSQPLFAQSIRPRSTLSKIWVPTGGVSATEGETGHGKLIRAGFLRQAQSGVFQLLPLGLRVQDKIERLIDKHMQNLGKVSSSSNSSTATIDLIIDSVRSQEPQNLLFRPSQQKRYGAKVVAWTRSPQSSSD
ncbi:hypothetical protein A9Z42_0079550 [Trichoderma parareesei]|uniref:Uncharacterized protein n=1 Tax=Trichoderma parareesei TaxID=858221 RepID=A0A2H2ZQT7_TRIPA|nr:hypothetical protein A9Z42_0079550 [Trichoderma parareesei]